MHAEALDHVALWVADRDALAAFATAHLGMHVIERTDRFTLVGADARRGKLTLFAAPGPREAGPLVRVALRVSDLEGAVRALPPDLPVERLAGEARFAGPEGLGIALVESPGDVEHELVALVAAVPDPEAAGAELAGLGLLRDGTRLVAGAGALELVHGEPAEPERPLLNHVGLLVADARAHLEEAQQLGAEIADVVDGANTFAVFVRGPAGIMLEYVEHKPTFSLV